MSDEPLIIKVILGIEILIGIYFLIGLIVKIVERISEYKKDKYKNIKY